MDEPLQQTPTHAAAEAEGALFGLDLSRLKWIVIAVIVGMVPGLLLAPTLGLPLAATIIFGPACLTAFVQLVLFQNRPPGWFIQSIDTKVTGAHLTPLPAPMSRPVLEALCADGAVVFPGAGRTLRVSRGFRIDVPEVRAAANGVRNHFGRSLSRAVGALPENGSMQIQWQVSNDFSQVFPAYAAATPADAPSAVQRLRNSKAIHYLEGARDGQIRRESVTLWLGQEVDAGRSIDDKDPAFACARALSTAESVSKSIVSPIEAALAPIGATVQSLEPAEVVGQWYHTLNPAARSDRGIVVPDAPALSLSDLCWRSELRGNGNNGFTLGGHCFSVHTVKTLPTATYPGILDILTTLPFSDYSLTVHLRRLPEKPLTAKLQARLSRLHRQLEQRHDPVLAVSQRQLEEKLEQLARGQVVPLEMEFIIVLHASTEDELRRREDQLRNATARMNGATLFGASLAASARNLFLKTLPGWLWSNDPGFVLYGESGYAADLLPVSSAFEAHLIGAEALYLGPHQNLIGVRSFVGEGHALTPQHCFISGANGTGKSYFLGRWLIETAPLFGYTAVFEEGLSHAHVTSALGGQTLIVTPDSPNTLNLFDSAGQPNSSFLRTAITGAICRMIGVSSNEERAREVQALIAKHVAELCQEAASEWLRRQPEARRLEIAREALLLERAARIRFCSVAEAYLLHREEFLSDANNKPTDAEVRAFAMKHRAAVNDLVYAYLPEYPTLSALFEHLDAEGLQDPACQNLANQLRPWCRGGLYGTLFDGPSNVTLTSSHTHIELGRIPESAKDLKAVLGFVLLMAVRQHLLTLPRHTQKRVVIEEVSRWLSVPGGEAILRELFEQFRKFHVQCVMVCQQVSQLGSESLRTAVLGNTRMAFIFHPGDAKDLDRISEHLPLSKTAKAMILRYSRPDQLRGQIYSECCYLHLTAREPYCGTIRFAPLPNEKL